MWAVTVTTSSMTEFSEHQRKFPVVFPVPKPDISDEFIFFRQDPKLTKKAQLGIEHAS
jgi:hypothetical protein